MTSTKVQKEIEKLRAKLKALTSNREAELVEGAEKIISELRGLGLDYGLTKNGKYLTQSNQSDVSEPVSTDEPSSTLTVDQRRNKIIECFADQNPPRLFASEIRKRTSEENAKALSNDLKFLITTNRITEHNPPTQEELDRLKDPETGKMPPGATPTLIYSLKQNDAS